MEKLRSQQRVVLSLMGRDRRFPRRPSAEMVRQFRVTWPQQIEADIIKTSMAQFEGEFRGRNRKARIVMMIHDAVWVEVPYEIENEVRHLIRRMMTAALKPAILMAVDFD